MGWNVLVTREIPDEGIAILEEHCEKVTINREERVLTPDELIGRCACDLLPPDLAHSRRQKFRMVVETAQCVQYEDVRADRVMDQRLCPILSDTGQVETFQLFWQFPFVRQIVSDISPWLFPGVEAKVAMVT